MEVYFAAGGLDANPRWTCRNINLTYNQLQVKHEKHPIVGTIYILLGFFFQVLYLLALSVIGTKDLLKHSCYKMMLCLGLFDFVCMIFSAQVSGYFYLVGAEYCMYPHLQYIIGSSIMGCFGPVCTLSLVLVMNRLIDFWRPDIAKKLFHGKKTWFWCFLCALYGMACFWKAPSLSFNVDVGTWIFNPLIPGNTYTDYSPMWLAVNNFITTSGICGSYVGFVVLHAYKLRVTQAVESTALQRNILRQAICICFFTFVTTAIWASMVFYDPSIFVLHLGQLCWHLMHAVPSLVYLLLNKTIQTRALRNLRNCTGIQTKVSYESKTSASEEAKAYSSGGVIPA
ncbi:unnamed protein product, partial [Mesorhabditis belari]|uniref:Uncharacterized protein n=1 Tax=Mesorhabditis belari TaxID=2138241 RepID=A0AAF3ELA9_9BILA